MQTIVIAKGMPLIIQDWQTVISADVITVAVFASCGCGHKKQPLVLHIKWQFKEIPIISS